MKPIYRDHYEIPFSSGQQPSEYARAANLCRKFGCVTYEEAVRLRDSGAAPVNSNPTRRVRSTKNIGRGVRCPYCQEMHRSQGLHVHVRNLHPAQYPLWAANPHRLRATDQEVSA